MKLFFFRIQFTILIIISSLLQGYNAFSNSLYSNKKNINNLSMHLHHDHTHHHDHEHSRISLKQYYQKIINVTKHPEVLLQTPQLKAFIIASTFLLISTFIKKKINKVDLIIFLAFSTTLSVFNILKTAFKSWILKMKIFKDGIAKHTTSFNTNYFFSNRNIADRVTLLGVMINIILSITKFFGGIAFNSAVLVADAGHSLSDLFSDFITLWAVQIARLPADEDHPYGHGKFESVGSLFLSLTLIATGISVGSWSYDRMLDVLIHTNQIVSSQVVVDNVVKSGNVATLFAHAVKSVRIPTWPALVLAGISIASKEWLYRITKRVGDSLNSQLLIANAWHHRSDAFSSILSLISIAAAIFLPGLLIADSAAGMFIAGMICITGLEILSQSVKQLTDSSDGHLVQELSNLAKTIEGVQGVRNVRARSVGSGSIVDMTVLTELKLSATAAHAIAERTKWNIMENFPEEVLDVLVRTQSAGTVCPLLSKNQRSYSDIEADIRKKLNNLEISNGLDNPLYKIKEVKRVTVHYLNSALICVDVLISLNSILSIDKAKEIAKEIQKQLMNSSDVYQAEIQLDLTDENYSSDGTKHNLVI